MEVFLLPTDARGKCFQKSIKIYIQITIAATWSVLHELGDHVAECMAQM